MFKRLIRSISSGIISGDELLGEAFLLPVNMFASFLALSVYYIIGGWEELDSITIGNPTESRYIISLFLEEPMT